MRALFALLFVVWAFYLWYGANHATLAAPCATTRTLPRNHRIVASDLKCDSEAAGARYLGAYAVGDINTRETLHPHSISDAPELRVGWGEAVFALNGGKGLPAGTDAGTMLTLHLPMGSPVQARVIAIVCASRADNRCKPLLAVPEASLPELVRGDASAIEVATAKGSK